MVLVGTGSYGFPDKTGHQRLERKPHGNCTTMRTRSYGNKGKSVLNNEGNMLYLRERKTPPQFIQLIVLTLHHVVNYV